jgi:hypothetical protein
MESSAPTQISNPRGEGVADKSNTLGGQARMLKRMLITVSCALILFACIVPVFAQNGQTMQNDMSAGNMKDDKMAGNKMSSKKTHHRKWRKRKSAKASAGHKM